MQWGFIVFTLVAILWGVLAVHPVFAGRAVAPMYVNRLPSGVPASSLQQGVVEVTTTYFILVGIMLVLIVVTRLFNPIDFDEYERYLHRILRLPPPRTPVSNPFRKGRSTRRSLGNSPSSSLVRS